jgi:hypothetical protein
MMRPEITSPGFDFRDEREWFKQIGNMVPGATTVCENKAPAPLVLKQAKATSNRPKTLVLVLLGIKSTSGALLLQNAPPGTGITTNAWPAA